MFSNVMVMVEMIKILMVTVVLMETMKLIEILVDIGGGGGEETLIEEVPVTTKPIIFFCSYFKSADRVS